MTRLIIQISARCFNYHIFVLYVRLHLFFVYFQFSHYWTASYSIQQKPSLLRKLERSKLFVSVFALQVTDRSPLYFSNTHPNFFFFLNYFLSKQRFQTWAPEKEFPLLILHTEISDIPISCYTCMSLL